MKSGRHNGIDTSKEFSQQSLLTALHQFVNAVDYMDETVMIPSRLRDMDFASSDDDLWITKNAPKHDHIHSAPPSPTFLNVALNRRRHSTTVDQQQQSVVSGGGNDDHTDEQNLYNFYNLLKAIKHEVVSGTPAFIPEPDLAPGIGGPHHLSSMEMEAAGEDYNKQAMPAAMCTSSSSSSSPSDEEDDAASAVDTEEDTDSVISDNSIGTEDSSKKVATSFRHHLRSLFGLLHQFTQTAKYLSHRYESEVGQSSASQVSSFAF